MITGAELSIQPTLELDLHPQNEFHFAEGTDSAGCCCFWKSKTVKPKEFYVDEHDVFQGCKHKLSHAERIKANQRLAQIVESKFQDDPIENNVGFERLKAKVNHDFDNGDQITEDVLAAIVNAIYEVRKES